MAQVRSMMIFINEAGELYLQVKSFGTKAVLYVRILVASCLSSFFQRTNQPFNRIIIAIYLLLIRSALAFRPKKMEPSQYPLFWLCLKLN